MTNQEIAKTLHYLAVDLELSGRIKESKACALASGLLLQLTPQDWELVTPNTNANIVDELTPQDVARAKQFADLVGEILNGGK